MRGKAGGGGKKVDKTAFIFLASGQAARLDTGKKFCDYLARPVEWLLLDEDTKKATKKTDGSG